MVSEASTSVVWDWDPSLWQTADYNAQRSDILYKDSDWSSWFQGKHIKSMFMFELL